MILIAALMILLFAFFEELLPDVPADYALTSNVAFFLLVNINIILLVLLVFLVSRNLLKLVLDRRRRILGSRLQGRLVVAFVGISLVPTLMLFLIAESLVTRSVDKWFDSQIVNALKGSLDISQTYYQNSANNALFFARQLSQRIGDQDLLEAKKADGLKRLVEDKQREYNLGTVEIYKPDRTALVKAFNDQVPTGVTVSPREDFLNSALRGLEVTRTQPLGEGDVLRGAVPVYGDGRRIIGVVVVDYFVPKSISKMVQQISRSYEEHKHLAILKEPVKTTYMLTLLLITLVMIFAATWFGLALAKGITVPIQQLAEGTHEVAHGNLDYRIDASGDDEIGTLVASFNQMTADLKRTNSELEQRRQYMETLLANITAGVISVDPSGTVTIVNKAAEQTLGIQASDVIRRHYEEALETPRLQPLLEVIEQVKSGVEVERGVRLGGPDGDLTLMTAAASLRDDDGRTLGIMVFMEDITEIQKVQRVEAWREVARRIAHEIKNPLTPIQLSAQRLRKRYENVLDGDGAVLDKCTSTIIRQVDELKTLVNEFQNFARLPTAELLPDDLNDVVREALFLFKEGHRDVEFDFSEQPSIPPVELDREQIKRALFNLLDNAVASLNGKGRVEIATRFDETFGMVRLEVADEGEGIAREDRGRVFEPYYSTKKDGTGLGLSIVGTIVADHRGYVRVRPNQPRGTRFIMEIPVTAQAEMPDVRTSEAS
ncbi:MAG: ATP-binding protein [Deltaproteobacteria bacterium]|nr:ATP-binding protein [Deltaproteobacteria bacterium]